MRALKAVVAIVAVAGCNNSVDLSSTVSAVEAGQPPTPVYQRMIQDAVTGDNTPVTVGGTVAPCAASAPCFVPDPGAESYVEDLFERPVRQGTNAATYDPALDIVTGQAGITPTWLYYRINVFGGQPGQTVGTGPAMPFHYGIEVNFDDDIQGDLIIDVDNTLGSTVGVNWSNAGVIAKSDDNETMGGPRPLIADGPGQAGGGYEHKQFDNGQNSTAGQPGGATAVQARINGSSLEIAVYRPWLQRVSSDPIVAMAFRPYAGTSSVSTSELYTHDDRNRTGIGSPYPWLAQTGAPASCPNGSSGDDGVTPAQIAALDSGTNVNTGIPNPCYALNGIYERDSAGTIHDLANKGDLQVKVDLTLTKTDNADPVGIGDPIIYTITVANTTMGTVTNARIVDTLPLNVVYVSSSPNCTFNAANRRVTCLVASIAPSSSTQVTVTVLTTVAGMVTNTATVTSDGDEATPANNTDDETTTIQLLCGNGLPNLGETCDDGNVINNDGCNNDCRLSNGQPCSDDNQCSSGVCDENGSGTCEPANQCGNGTIEPANGEVCDDGNVTAGDGCEADCKLGLGQPCTNDNQCNSGECDELGSQTCEPASSCGNGTVNPGEVCDDGNNVNGDGCEADCKRTDGQPCTDNNQCHSGVCDPTSMVCEPADVCGNHVVESGEFCDDGNTTNGDGCESDCKLGDGQPCTDPDECHGVCDPNSHVCEPADVCGNGIVETGEGCDDGNTTADDGCSPTCKKEDGQPCTDGSECQSGTCDPGTNTCGGTDTDGDGIFDSIDIDDDNDGILDMYEDYDTDGDGVPNSIDLDSDNDGIPDATEAGHSFKDSDGNFVMDCPTGYGANGFCDAAETAVDSGMPTNAGVNDADVDGLPDARDEDSDNDGVSDVLESGARCADENNDGICDGTDDDLDGIASSIDTVVGFGTTGVATAPDTDADGAPDFRDLDSDADTVFDIQESSNAALDSNHNGIIDSGVDRDGDGVRDVADDSDLDGEADSTDPDPARFGGLHSSAVNTDGDGKPDFQDDDSDNDTVLDLTDNCRINVNTDQADRDNDRIGDACDPTDDRDWSLQGGCGGCATGGSGSTSLVFMLGVLGMITGRRRRRSARSAAAAAAVAMLAVPAVVHAQAAETVPGDFGTERFQLATDKDGILDIESATVRRHLELDMALWLGYANDPLVLNRTDAGRMEVGSLVKNQVDGELIGTVGLFGRAQLGVVVPLIVLQDNNISSSTTAPTAPSGSFALGDIRLVPKVQLMSQGDYGVNVALLATLTLPTNTGDGFAGDTSVTFSPALALSRRFETGMRTGLMAGYRAREKNMALDLEINDEVFAGVGLGYDFATTGGPPIGLEAAFSLATAADDMFGAFNRNYAEVDVGGSVDVPGPLVAFVASGFGVAEGWGTPDWRALAGVRVDRGQETPKAPTIVDTDKDGLLDNVDRCPLEPEDMDGFEDTDGCPDVDDDKDGIPDVSDACRTQPEDMDGFEDTDGCPEDDNDKDKILDANDKCPNEAEDVDSFQDDDGCPDNDNDNDTVLDEADKCRDVPGAVDNDGCPWPDTDGDGVIDKFDNCPTWKGKPENNGCALPQLVKITESKLELYETVYFATGRAVIQRRSFRMLNQIADVIRSHTDLVIRIEGHTDSVGSNASNMKLSQSRADAVMKYLVKRGVEQSRLSAKGFGEEQPIDDNKTATGRSHNRRVEFMATRTIETVQQAPATPGQTAPAPASGPAPAPAPATQLEKP